MFLEKPIFRLMSVIFFGFSIILGYRIADVGFGYKNKTTLSVVFRLTDPALLGGACPSTENFQVFRIQMCIFSAYFP